MRYIISFTIVLFVAVFIISCKPSNKELKLGEFLKIEEEVLSGDLTPEFEEAVAKKYGFTLKQYKDFEEKIENDPEIKAKAGEMRLQMQHKAKDIK